MQTTVIRSKRKSFSMQLKESGLIVRAPLWANEREIEDFILKHRSWIEKQARKQAERKRRAAEAEPIGFDEMKRLAKQATLYIPGRVEYYARLIGVTYGRITIRNQRSRWGSCSAKGNLNFNCLLMLTPPEVIDSVVVHELCHRKEMNHSARFYAEVLRVFPEYRRWDRWLKENGGVLMERAFGTA